MRCKRLVFILCIVALLILAACKSECKVNTDCTAKSSTAYSASCVDKKCVYTPIPNQCGNGQCEVAVGENECTCTVDCGSCAGPVTGSKYLVKQCVRDKCIEDVSSTQIKPIYSSADLSSASDKFKIDTVYNQPFNMKKDTFDLRITLTQRGSANSDEHILNLELTALTSDRRTITLARPDVDKYLWSQGSSITENVIFAFPTGEIEGELSSITLKVQYEYSVMQAGKKVTKQATLQSRYREKLTYVNPRATYPCPESCEDNNPGTKDYCDERTKFFCKHDPIPGKCGNFQCDGTETKCTCPDDCGLCSGSAGNFLDFTCSNDDCITVLKAGANIQSKSLFDDRSLGPVQLNNNYRFNMPFNVKEDTFELDFSVYRQDPTVSDVEIETVRILEGAQQIAQEQVNTKLSSDVTTVSISIPSITEPEEEHNFKLGIWYKYIQDGNEKRGKYEKSIGKITLISPE